MLYVKRETFDVAVAIWQLPMSLDVESLRQNLVKTLHLSNFKHYF